MKKFLAFLLLFCLPLSASAEIEIVASLFPQYDFARTIAGDRASVTQLLPPGQDSHGYEPSMREVISMSQADIFLYTGDAMEPWASALMGNSETLMIVDVSEGISNTPDHGHEEDHEEDQEEDYEESHSHDAHIWLNPANAILMCENICAALIEADPEGEAFYRANTDALIAELTELDKAFASLEIDHTLFFAGKFAYSHFFDRYGFEYMSAYESCSADAEPSARRVVEITQAMKDEKAAVLYVDELCDMRVADALKNETGAEIRVFHTCHNITSEQMEAGVTYLDLMYENLKGIAE